MTRLLETWAGASQLAREAVQSRARDIACPVEAGEFGGVELIDLIAAEWRALCNEGTTDEPFFRPEWVGASVRAFVPDGRLLLVTARVDGRLRAVLPLVEERRFFAGLSMRVLRSAGSVHCSRFDLVRAPGAEGDAAVRAIWRFLKECPRWDKLEFEYVPPEAALEGLVTAAALDDFPTERRDSWRTPYIPLRDPDGQGRPWLESTSSKFRANLHRRRRNLSARGSLALRRFTEADPRALQCLYELERSGWKGREGSAIASHVQTRRFYDEVAKEAARFGYLCLYLLELDGHALAAHFGIAHRGRYFLPKPAYDEAFRQYSPGHVLIHEVLRDCSARAFREFDFLGATADWKAEWTTRVRPHSVWHVFHKSPRGRAFHALQFRVKKVVKVFLGRA